MGTKLSILTIGAVYLQFTILDAAANPALRLWAFLGMFFLALLAIQIILIYKPTPNQVRQFMTIILTNIRDHRSTALAVASAIVIVIKHFYPSIGAQLSPDGLIASLCVYLALFARDGTKS